MPIRAVLDTNGLLSGLLSKNGPPGQIVDAWLDGRFTLVTSLYLVEEINHVLTYPRLVKRLRLSPEEQKAFLAALLTKAEVVPGHLRFPGATRDPKDDSVIACAVEGTAAFIVSGDEDLLTLQSYAGIHIVTPSEFLKILKNMGI